MESTLGWIDGRCRNDYYLNEEPFYFITTTFLSPLIQAYAIDSYNGLGKQSWSEIQCSRLGSRSNNTFRCILARGPSLVNRRIFLPKNRNRALQKYRDPGQHCGTGYHNAHTPNMTHLIYRNFFKRDTTASSTSIYPRLSAFARSSADLSNGILRED